MAEPTPKPKPKRKVYVGVRIDPDDLDFLTKMGADAKPVPANQSEMIQAAVREYVDKRRPKKK